MPRARNPNRERSYQIWLEHGGEITNRQIAEIIGENEKVVAVWKQRDKWNVVQQSDESCTTNENSDPFPPRKGSVDALPAHKSRVPKRMSRNKGGQTGNGNAVTHGFFQRYFPDDAETQALLSDVEGLSAADMLWINIKTQFTAIIRAQKLMFVTNQDDMTKEVRRTKRMSGEQMDVEEDEWEIQFAWDKHATYLNAQARAMSELRSLIKDFLSITGQDDKRRLELEQMQQNIRVEQERLEIDRAKAKLDQNDDKVIKVKLPDAPEVINDADN